MAADYTCRTYVNADAATTWDAIVNPDKTVKFFYGTRVDCAWTAGAPMRYVQGDSDQVVSTGEIISVDAPNRYECLFHAQWDADLAAEGPVREIWTLKEINGMTELVVELFDAPPGSKTYDDFATGFPYILAGLKSVVETGVGLPPPY